MLSPMRRFVGLARAKLLVAALVTLSLPAHAQPASTCAVTTKEEIAALAELWNGALATGNPDSVANLYADDAVLLPMLSSEPRMGRQQIRSYFEVYLRRHPKGLISMRLIMVGCNVASDIGTYTYRLTGRRKGTREAIGGRYSTLYEFREGKWLIVQQHASTLTSTQKARKQGAMCNHKVSPRLRVGLPSSLRVFMCDRTLAIVDPILIQRKDHLQRRSLVQLAVDLQLAMMLFHNPGDEGEAQTHAAGEAFVQGIVSLGSEVGFGAMLQRFFAHADAIVADAQQRLLLVP